jgi:hypothetical protein
LKDNIKKNSKKYVGVRVWAGKLRTGAIGELL